MTEIYGPGPDGNAGDNYNEDPRGVDGKSDRLHGCGTVLGQNHGPSQD